MKVSVITAVLNGEDTLEDCLRSVSAQTHRNVEHVIVDDGSSDGTADILRRWNDPRLRWSSEKHRGLYATLNQGLQMARGDVIGILGCDDLYQDDRAIELSLSALAETGSDTCYGDLVYVDAVDTHRVIRYWKGGVYDPGRFRWGWMPPHPTFFARREVYERYGGFDPSMRISADYEMMLRLLLRHGVSAAYVPRVQVRMRVGGISNRGLPSLWRRTVEDLRAWRDNDLVGGIPAVALKKVRKLPQFILRPALGAGEGGAVRPDARADGES